MENSTNLSQQHLIIFTRYPEANRTKTRLIPLLGAEGAANLQRQMTEHTLLTVKQLQMLVSVSVEVRFAGGNLQLMQAWLGNNLFADNLISKFNKTEGLISSDKSRITTISSVFEELKINLKI